MNDVSKTVRKIFSLPESLSQQIDDFRFARRLKTESEAIRMLVEAGLAAETGQQPRARKRAT
jgi:metal-responsive CopG/Arc/MetJ family transcriptional regulator